MKKLLIGVIMFIPLLVLASVFLTAKIVSVEAYIGVDSLELSEESVEISNIGDSYQLSATLLPSAARNKSVRWEISDLQLLDDRFEMTDDNPAATIDSNGKVSVYAYCAFTVYCVSDDGGRSDSCNFLVKGDSVEEIALSGVTTLKSGERAKYELMIYPAEALIDSNSDVATWSSSNSAVFTVDGNGIVTAVGNGTATLSAELIVGGTSFTKSVDITVTAGSFKTTDFYTTESSIAVASFANVTNLVVVSGGTIEDGTFTFTAADAVVTADEASVRLHKVAANAIGFNNAYLLDGSSVKMSSVATRLELVKLSTGERVSNAVFTSSDDSIAVIGSDGALHGIGRGDVIITAEVEGQTAQIAFTISKPITYFKLHDSEKLDARGIAAETVYANASYVYKDEGGYTFNYTRRFTVDMPAAASADDFIWTSSNPDVAYFDEEDAGLLHYAENFEGEQTITVTATAKLPVYASRPVSGSYTFTVVDGVSVSNTWELDEATERLRIPACITQNINVKWENDRVEDFYCHANIYGNGHIVANVNPEHVWEGWILFRICRPIKVSNLTIRNAGEPQEGQTVDKTGHKQVGIEFCYYTDEAGVFRRNVGGIIEYCIVEYCMFGIRAYGSDFTVNGSIIRNTSNYGIYAAAYGEWAGYNNYNNVVVNNCIFSNSVATAIGLPNFQYTYGGDQALINYEVIGYEEDGTPIYEVIGYEEDGVTPIYKPMRCYTSLVVSGFCDIYNWATIDNLDLFTRMTDSPTLDNMIKGACQGLVMSEDYARFRFTVGDKHYFHLGIMCAGALHKSSAVVTDSNGVKLGTEGSNMPNFVNMDADLYGIVEPIQFYIYDNTSSITPLSTYSDTAATYAALRGE